MTGWSLSGVGQRKVINAVAVNSTPCLLVVDRERHRFALSIVITRGPTIQIVATLIAAPVSRALVSSRSYGMEI